jgi:hypothetical protein
MIAPQPHRPCVRCGVNPRAPALFVCVVCHADPMMRREIEAAERIAPAYGDQRTALIRNHNWAGGWPKPWA